MRARDVIGKRITDVRQEQFFDRNVGALVWEIKSIGLEDGTRIVLHAFECEADNYVGTSIIKPDKKMATHPNRNWRRQWTVDLERHEARHTSGLVVRFKLDDERDSWEVAGYEGQADDLARRLRQALEVFVAAARARP